MLVDPIHYQPYSPDKYAVEISHLTKVFRDDDREISVFKDFSLDICVGEVVSILGASGCGKSTLLNIISGTEDIDEGCVTIDRDNVGYMFQTDLLMPWRTARSNALLALEIKGKQAEPACLQKLRDYFVKLNLKDSEDCYPGTLSGGMRQRVALIRTLLFEPDTLLLDEPFSALDFKTKLALEKLVLEFAREQQRTVLFVTHDIDEAIAVASRLVVLERDAGEAERSRVVFNEPIEFAGDIVGRDPIAVRQDAKFPWYVKKVWEALKGKSC